MMHWMDVPEQTGAGQRKRKYRRIDVPGFVGSFADGQRMIDGVVDNISTGGFEIINLPSSFDAEKYLYRAVLSGGGKHYKVLARPCWRRQKGTNEVDVGFKILDAPWKWLELTMQGMVKGEDNKMASVRA